MNLTPEKWTLLLLSLIFVSLLQLNRLQCKNYDFNCTFMYVNSQKFGYFGHWLSDVNTLEMKIFGTHLVFICNTFDHKPKISMKPQNADF